MDLKQSALTDRAYKCFFIRSNEKYIGRRYNFVTTGKENQEFVVKTGLSIVYLQIMFDEIQKDTLTEILVFLEGVKLKKTQA